MKAHILTVCSIDFIFYKINLVNIKHIGSQQEPKDICKDRNIGTWKSRNVESFADNETVLGNT